MALILGLIGLIMASPCPAQESLFSSAEEQFFAGRIDRAEQFLENLFRNLDCEQPYDAVWVDRLWVLEGTLHHYQKEEDSALRSFQSVHQRSSWPESYGNELYRRFITARAIAPDPVPLELSLPRRYTAYVDGQAVTKSTKVSMSPHLLQIFGPGAQPALSLRHDFSAGQPSLPSLPRARSTTLAISTASMAAAALTSIVVAQHNANLIRSTEDPSQLQRSYNIQQAALISAGGLTAITAGLGAAWWWW